MNKPVVLISGAAGGLGSALARAFGRRDADLMLLDRDARGLDRLSDEMQAAGLAEPALCPLDLAVAGPEAYLELAGILERELGGVHHIVHCAAHFGGLAPMDQISPGEWVTSMQVNLTAAWAMTVACVPLLRSVPNASVTFVVDEAERSENAYWGAYGVSKAALASLARILGQELDPTGVRVSTFNPGPMRTGLRASAYLAEDPASQPEPAQAAARLVSKILD